MKAMVLCAGFGTRLGVLTRELPKAMLPLHGHPLVAYLLGHLRTQGWTDIAINLHFRPDLITRWLGDGSHAGLRITYSLEEQLLGTAGALKRLEATFRPERAFLVHYGDILTDQDFGPLLDLHLRRGALATLLVHPRPRSNSVVVLDETTGQISAFLERPTDAERAAVTSPWVNSGVCIASPELLDFIPDKRPADLPRDVFLPLIATGRLFAVPLRGYRCAIDSPERLQEAAAAVAEGRCRVTPLPGCPSAATANVPHSPVQTPDGNP